MAPDDQEVRLSRTEGQQRRRRVCPRLGEAVHISAGLTFGQREKEISANLPKRQTGRAVPTRSIWRRAREDKTFEGESFESVQARAVEDGRGQGSSEKKMGWHRSKMKLNTGIVYFYALTLVNKSYLLHWSQYFQIINALYHKCKCEYKYLSATVSNLWISQPLDSKLFCFK